MKSAIECFQEAAKCEAMAGRAMTDIDRLRLLDAAVHWKRRGEEIQRGKAPAPVERPGGAQQSPG